MERNGFVFFAEYFAALQMLETLSAKDQLAVYKAIIRKGLSDIEPSPEELPVAARAMWVFLGPKMEAYSSRYDNGNRGGRPRKAADPDADPSEAATEITETKPNDNRNETEAKPNDNQSITETKPNDNRNETETKPNDNQSITETKPKGGNIKPKTLNIKHNIYRSSSSVLPLDAESEPSVKEEEEREGEIETELETELENGDAELPINPPEVDVRMVRTLCRKHGVDEDAFVASYAGRGWTINGEPIRDMEALIRRCGENAKKARATAAAKSQPSRSERTDPEHSSFDTDEFMITALRNIYGADADCGA